MTDFPNSTVGGVGQGVADVLGGAVGAASDAVDKGIKATQPKEDKSITEPVTKAHAPVPPLGWDKMSYKHARAARK